MFVASGSVYCAVCAYAILCSMDKGGRSWYSMCKKTVFMRAFVFSLMCMCISMCMRVCTFMHVRVSVCNGRSRHVLEATGIVQLPTSG